MMAGSRRYLNTLLPSAPAPSRFVNGSHHDDGVRLVPLIN